MSRWATPPLYLICPLPGQNTKIPRYFLKDIEIIHVKFHSFRTCGWESNPRPGEFDAVFCQLSTWTKAVAGGMVKSYVPIYIGGNADEAKATCSSYIGIYTGSSEIESIFTSIQG